MNSANKINAYEACKILKVNFNGLNQIDLKLGLRDKKRRYIQIQLDNFDKNKIHSLQNNHIVIGIRENYKFKIFKNFDNYCISKGFSSLMPLSKIPPIHNNTFYCPNCKQYIEIPPHFKHETQKFDDRFLWLCSAITHYRHQHSEYDESISEIYEDSEVKTKRNYFNMLVIEKIKNSATEKEYLMAHHISDKVFNKLNSLSQNTYK